MGDQHLDIEKMAVKAFADHRLSRLGGFTWRFGKPGSSSYAVKVTWAPGAVIVTGDLGEIVYRGMTDFWTGPWDAARFLVDCDYDYITGKTSAAKVFDRDASVLDLLRTADDRMRWGCKDLWIGLCKRYSDTWAVDYAELSADRVTDHMKAARALRNDVDLSPQDLYHLTSDGEHGCYSYPPGTRWQYEGLMRWAKAMTAAEPVTSKAARQWRRFRAWKRSFKSYPVIYQPTLYVGPKGYGSLKFWRHLDNGCWRLLIPLRVGGFDLSALGFWRDQGTQFTAHSDSEFKPYGEVSEATLQVAA